MVGIRSAFTDPQTTRANADSSPVSNQVFIASPDRHPFKLRKTRLSGFVACGFAVVVLMIASTSFAQDNVVVTRLNGETIAGTLQSVDSNGSLVGSEFDSSITLNDISTIATDRTVATNAGSGTSFMVRLVGGSSIWTNSITLERDTYRIETVAGDISLGAEAIQAIIFVAHRESASLARLLNEPNATNDRLIAITSSGEQVVAGVLRSFSNEKIELEFQDRLRTISVSENVVGVVLADLRQSLPEGTRVRALTIDGSTIAGTFRSLGTNQLRLGLAGSKEIVLDWQKIARIHVQSDRLVYLSDLQPVSVQEQALGTIRFPWQVDQNVFGRPLTLFDPTNSRFREYPRGLGTHSYCRLEYEIAGAGYTRLMALVGLDSAAQHRGDCEVAVLGDGVELWSSRIKGHEPPHPIDVDVKNVSRLVLLVKPGEHLDLGDHVNWVDARLLK